MSLSWIDANVSLSGFSVVIAAGAAACLFYAYVGYPALMAILASLVRTRPKQPGYEPKISVLITAYNEAATIGRKIEQTLKLNYRADRLDILVVSDGSNDGTDQIVRSFEDRRVRLLRIDDRKGKTNGQNEGVKCCGGEVIVFSDATAVYHADALRYLACHYEEDGVGAVSGRYQYFDPDGTSPSGLGSVAFWNYENWIKRFQSRVATLTGCSGCIYSVRKAAYVPLPPDACSDLVEPLQIVKNGYRVVFEDRALAYEETTTSSTEEFRMRVRVGTRGIRGVLSVPALLKPWIHPWTAFQLFSHKIMRWLAPVFLMALWISSAVLAWRREFLYLFAAQTLLYAWALFSLKVPLHKYWKPLGLPLFFCTLNAAAAVSLVEVVRGHKYTTWQTVRSTAKRRPELAATVGTGKH
jgi:cellulose synthase/poly-beta-1,6-N-acetylglucosamine synthase-like glycosyltransferase